MQSRCRSVNCFDRERTINEGSYGVVHKARDKETGEVVALKKIKMNNGRGSKRNRTGFPITSLREINILQRIRHPNIIQLKEVVVGVSYTDIYMVMEFMEHDVHKLMASKQDPFSQSEVKCLMLQLLSGVEALHNDWIFHRDLKTSNLLMNNEGILKICDMGLSRKFSSPIHPYTSNVVTLWYRAPELLLGSDIYSCPIDMWSVGCIFAEFLLKKPLFEGVEGEIAMVGSIFSLLGSPTEATWPGLSDLPYMQKFSWKEFPHATLPELFPRVSFSGGAAFLSAAGYDLLTRLLCYDPNQRITATEALAHPWFTETPLPQDPSMISMALPRRYGDSTH